jgi:ParB-like chromosome segregation protein Spo0J
MEIKKINKKHINPAPYNPRKNLKPGDPEYEKLKRSIEEFGFIEPLVWNKRTGNLCGGHQRYKILLARGDEEFECSVVDLDLQREKALNLALNKVTGDWDGAKLKDILADLDDGLFDMSLTGFDNDEIEELMTQYFKPADIDDLLSELDMSKAIEKPIWATIRTKPENQEIIERVLVVLEQSGIRVERSYET